MDRPTGHNWSRRDVLRSGSAILTAALAGCAPLRILTGDYPAAFKQDNDLDDRVLRAFVATIVPGVALDAPDLARVFRDEFFPFAKYQAFFASDLCDRAGKLFHQPAFDRLTLAERTRVVQHGLQADGVTQRLYRGAIILAQAATYGGIYSKSGDVSLIGYQGFRYHPDLDGCTHPEPRQYLAAPLTATGNPA